MAITTKESKHYELTIQYDGIFGGHYGKAWLKKKTIGWDYWVENTDGSKRKLTRGRKYLVGETLEQVIANIECGGEYADRKVIKIDSDVRQSL